METTIKIRCTHNQIVSIFNKGINNNADIRYYECINDELTKVIVRHNDGVILKENATYSLSGFLKRCNTELDNLRAKLSQLEDKLYAEQCRQHGQINRMGWGHAMRNVKFSISTTKEDRLKERISELKKRIKELQN